MFTERFIKLLVLMGLFAFIPAIVLFLWKEPVLDFAVPVNKQYLGQFGNFVSGIIGSLWALAGVILFYVALKAQREDFQTNRSALEKQVEALNLQAEEFRLQRDEIEHTRTVYEEQSKSLRKQQFESTFFSLLNVYSRIVSDIDNNHSCDYFSQMASHLLTTTISTDNPMKSHNDAVQNYIHFYFSHKAHLSHYFKSIYRLMKLIDDSHLSDADKFFYSKIVRSQLKEDEIFLLFYNAHTEYGKNFRSMILKYNLFKHLPSISKIEFSIFSQPATIAMQANRLQYCEWIHSMLSHFVNDMSVNKFSLMSEEAQDISIRNDPLESIFELSTDDMNKLELSVIFDKDARILEQYLSLDTNEFAKFQQYLLYDFLQFSTFRIDRLSVGTSIEADCIKFNLRSRNGFNIVTDAF